MPIAPYIKALRDKVGRGLLVLPAVSAIVVDDGGRILLHRSSDDGKWHIIGGAVEPGEQPADAVVREVLEETGVEVEPVRLTGVYGSDVTYPNGDAVYYVASVFLCRPVGGAPRVADDESLEVKYFAPDALPDLPARHLQRICDAVSGRIQANYLWKGGGEANG